MQKRGRGAGGAKRRWIIVAGALLVTAATFYVLVHAGGESGAPTATPTAPALDDIDAESREAMRELLRDAEGTE